MFMLLSQYSTISNYLYLGRAQVAVRKKLLTLPDTARSRARRTSFLVKNQQAQVQWLVTPATALHLVEMTMIGDVLPPVHFGLE